MNLRQLSSFTRQFSTLLEAGIPVLRALEACRNEAPAAVDQLLSAVRRGAALSRAMASAGDAFPEAYVQAITVGERTGSLILVLDRLAGDLERDDRHRRRLIAVLTYPAIMSMVACAVALLFIYVLLPVMEDLFRSMHLNLPWLTRAVLGLGALIRHPLVILPVLLLPVSLWVSRRSLRAWLSRSALGLELDRLLLEMPVVRARLASRMLYLLALLLDAGAPLVEALSLIGRASGNRAIELELEEANRRIFLGEGLGAALAGCTPLQSGSLQLLAAGEESARLPRMALSAASMCELEADHLTEVLSALIEPVLMVAMGIVSGILFVAVLLPMGRLLSSVG